MCPRKGKLEQEKKSVFMGKVWELFFLIFFLCFSLFHVALSSLHTFMSVIFCVYFTFYGYLCVLCFVFGKK